MKTIGRLQEEDGPGRIVRTKAIRILSLAPSLDNRDALIMEWEMSEQSMRRPRNGLQELWMIFNGEDAWSVINGHNSEDEGLDEGDETD